MSELPPVYSLRSASCTIFMPQSARPGPSDPSLPSRVVIGGCRVLSRNRCPEKGANGGKDRDDLDLVGEQAMAVHKVVLNG